MKGYILLLLSGLMLSFNTAAGRITMSNPDQSTTANGRTLCVYSNSIYMFTYITKSKKCPYSKIFDTAKSGG
ncbi:MULTISPECIES: hypothetical protein [Enterobacterales]|uniref:Uncharacterized protein n=1 Tax=Kluyvera genomosp. 2 TaxID=2774054 RepID=A0A2T2XZ86_9ENTR|nr:MULTISPECIES: hypothetical protein [Enterobacterales]KHT08244.1 hypothetical protein RC91_03250 [Pectobacterium brasiliense]PSR45571.1 hypothetical protein C8256_17760 [Kluyvera genomosp. 2]